MSDITPEQQQFVADCGERLGFAVDAASVPAVIWQPTDAPGGDSENIAHTHIEPDLRRVTIEYNFANAETPRDVRRTVVHECIHVALRHIGSVVAGLADPVAKAWLTQAIEEDTEALAVALEAAWP